MFPLTHIVLGGGATWASQRLLRRMLGGAKATGEQRREADPTDYRLVAAGAMLPDIIDKPLGIYLLRRQLGSGRIFGHTLLFSLGLMAGSSLLTRQRRHWLLSLGLGVVTHTLADRMMLSPQNFFWPLCGLRFPRDRRLEGWGWRMLHHYYSHPQVLCSEVSAALVMLTVGRHLSRRGRLGRFLASGRL